MARMRFTIAMVTLSAILPVAGCAGDPAPPARPAPAAAEVVEYPRYAVGLRELPLVRSPGRPLRTVLLYPAAGPEGALVAADAAPAEGKFPIVLFSHGLHGTPERYIPAASSWTAAGFVVALPAYPYTREHAPDYRREDMANQPADASFVIRKVRDLGKDVSDPLHNRIDGNHVAAIGHSAGGYTTAGMFNAGHDERLRSGVVLAGWMAPGAFKGPPATMLFMQGDSDPVVPIAYGRAAYDKVPWKKSYVLLPRNYHAQYMLPGNRGYPEMDSIITDFLRWTLNGDEAAHLRLPPSSFPVNEAS